MDQSAPDVPAPGDTSPPPSSSSSSTSAKPETETGSKASAPDDSGATSSGSTSAGADKPDSSVVTKSSGSSANSGGGSAGDGSSVSDSPKVQFGAGTKQRDGSETGVKRIRRSFKEVASQEFMSSSGEGRESPPTAQPTGGGGGGTPSKSILKTSRSEPILSAEDSEKKVLGFVNKAYEEDAEDATDSASGQKTKAKTDSGATAAGSKTKSVGLPLIRRHGSTSSGGSRGFADVVDLLIQRSSIDLGGRDMHPFGRDCSIEGIMQASRPKSHSKNSAFGKLVIWMTLLSILVGAALGIIFLSEMYSTKLREEKQLRASLNLSMSET